VYQLTLPTTWTPVDFGGITVSRVSIGQAGIYAVNKANDCIKKKVRVASH
jgi:hypothetical protein